MRQMDPRIVTPPLNFNKSVAFKEAWSKIDSNITEILISAMKNDSMKSLKTKRCLQIIKNNISNNTVVIRIKWATGVNIDNSHEVIMLSYWPTILSFSVIPGLAQKKTSGSYRSIVATTLLLSMWPNLKFWSSTTPQT